MFGKVRARLPLSQHKTSALNLCSLRELDSVPLLYDGMGNPVTLRYPGGPDSSMVEHLVQFQKGLGSSPGPVTFHAAILYRSECRDLIHNARGYK